MYIWDDWKLELGVDQVLQAQGLDPHETRLRRPSLVDVAGRAIAEFSAFLTPRVALNEYAVVSHLHSYLLLQDDLSLHGQAIVKALAEADALICGLATLGPALEAAVDRTMLTDPTLGLAVDGLGNAALDLLQIETCRRIEAGAFERNRHASIIYSPGMVGWDVLESQPQVFELAPAAEIGVTLNDDLMLVPHKSISFVIGLSPRPFGQRTMCEVCGLRDTCRYHGSGSHG